MNHAERERLFLDLFQEIMSNVWNALPAFRGESQPGTWLYRIAVNTALLYRRKWKRGEEFPELADPSAASSRISKTRSASPPSPSSRNQDRLVITLLLEGLSYREIAEITGLTVNYVGVKLSRIKHAIEQRMTEVNHGSL